MVDVHVIEGRLTLRGDPRWGGETVLNRWLGPALRGIVDWALKQRICTLPLAEQKQHSRCAERGGWICPALDECLYGSHFEHFDDRRLAWLAVDCPIRETLERDIEVRVLINSIGPNARVVAGLCADVLRDASNAGRTLGSHQVPFEFERTEASGASWRLQPDHFPCDVPADGPVVPYLGVMLTSPLFLRLPQSPEAKQKQRASQDANLCPSFADLFRVSEGLMQWLFERFRQPLPEQRTALREQAARIRMVENCYEPFEQTRSSHRAATGAEGSSLGQSLYRSRRAEPRHHGHSYEATGVLGGAVFENVPLAFVPWLLWAGRLHVGGQRSAGAGSWRLVLQ